MPDILLRNWFLERIPGTLKEPAGCLQYPFIDPGSVYDGNLWDWDTFWASYGVLNLVDKEDTTGKFVSASGREWQEYVKGNILNFFDHQEPDGYIPMMVEAHETVPYLIRKHREGVLLNMHKPFLARQISMISGWSGDSHWASNYRENLLAYFNRYDEDYYQERSGLYAWADDVMIGMDNDPASFGRPRFSTANIFLNSFMVEELIAGSGLLKSWDDDENSNMLRTKADKLVEAIRRECWDERDKFFYSVDIDIKTRAYDWFHKNLGVFWNTLPIKIRAWSGFLPLWAGFASPDEAEALVTFHAKDPNTFASEYGICSLAMDEKMFDLRETNNPSNWLGPIWLVVQYCVFRGLMRYGYHELAEDLYKRVSGFLIRDIERTGVLHEYYDPFTGDPVVNGGFVNWNILVLNMADELQGKKPIEDFIR